MKGSMIYFVRCAGWDISCVVMRLTRAEEELKRMLLTAAKRVLI